LPQIVAASAALCSNTPAYAARIPQFAASQLLRPRALVSHCHYLAAHSFGAPSANHHPGPRLLSLCAVGRYHGAVRLPGSDKRQTNNGPVPTGSTFEAPACLDHLASPCLQCEHTIGAGRGLHRPRPCGSFPDRSFCPRGTHHKKEQLVPLVQTFTAVSLPR
jgi:hypothetical protein